MKPEELQLLSQIVTLIATPVSVGIVAEWRLSRQRKWQASMHQENTERIETLQSQVATVGEDARAAYHEANGVNEWRKQLTEQLGEKQDQTLHSLKRVEQVTTDTNRRVEVVASRPATPQLPIIILPSEENDDV